MMGINISPSCQWKALLAGWIDMQRERSCGWRSRAGDLPGLGSRHSPLRPAQRVPLCPRPGSVPAGQTLAGYEDTDLKINRLPGREAP